MRSATRIKRGMWCQARAKKDTGKVHRSRGGKDARHLMMENITLHAKCRHIDTVCNFYKLDLSK